MGVELVEYIPQRIWIAQYPVRYAGLDFYIETNAQAVLREAWAVPLKERTHVASTIAR